MPHSISDDSHLFAEDHVFYGDVPNTTKSASTAAAWHACIGRAPIAVDPAVCDVFAGNTRDLEALTVSPTYEELRRSIDTIGQQTPAIARISMSNPSRLEIIAGASRLTAIRELNDAKPKAARTLVVQVQDLDDADAYKLVEGENAGRAPFSPIEKARLYESAKLVFGHDAAVAEELGIHKSTVGRTLDILRLPAALTNLVSDHHQISAAQADAFMKNWNEPLLQHTLAQAIAQFDEGPSSAGVVFKAMKDAVEPRKHEVVARVLLKDGTDVGTARMTKGGGFRIDLRPVEIGEHPMPLVLAIADALKQL